VLCVKFGFFILCDGGSAGSGAAFFWYDVRLVFVGDRVSNYIEEVEEGVIPLYGVTFVQLFSKP
jgi:hypothetical protein